MVAPQELDQEKLTLICRLICSGLTKGEIKHIFKTRHKMNYRTFETYLTAAKVELRESTDKSDDDWLRETIGFLQSIKQSKDANPREKVLAQKELNKILGIKKPADPELPSDPEFTEARRANIEGTLERLFARREIGKAAKGETDTPDPN